MEKAQEMIRRLQCKTNWIRHESKKKHEESNEKKKKEAYSRITRRSSGGSSSVDVSKRSGEASVALITRLSEVESS